MPTARDATPPPGTGGRRKLPIGIQTFGEIRTGGYYYVDKTAGLRRLIDAGKHFFLSRPRRFGKSLLVDTLKQLFEGNRPLFEGLAIHDHWDWTVRHPVLQLDFSGGDFTAPDALPAHVADQMAAAERRAGLAGAYASIPGRFAGLIEALHQQSGQRVVVLVDEYDKPILDALEGLFRAFFTGIPHQWHASNDIPDVSVRIQGGGASRRGGGVGAVARQALCREVSGLGARRFT